MGFISQRKSCTISPDPLSPKLSSPSSVSDQESPEKSKKMIRKMSFEYGLSCFHPPLKRINSEHDEKKSDNNNSEHNKGWLLADSGGCGGAEITYTDPHMMQSSFRFTFCSQVELESMKMKQFCSATVLMVNLDNGVFMGSPRSRVVKWSRIESLERNISPVAHNLVRFTYSEILSATNNFSKGRVLGRGALSCVYKGKIGLFGTSVAIKKLDKQDEERSKAFCRELMIASSLHSPYIVPLVGFCIGPQEDLFLVYKYVSCGSLEQFLHEKKKTKGNTSLPWSVRYKIAVGIAKAVEYLHNGTERCVVHRDIKPSNILLSSRKTPKLCDFGLATWTRAPSVPFLCKTVKGTFGYLAPEYFQHGKISDKTDVYALGVVLLELVTGRKPIETRKGTGEENLISWAKPFLQQGAVEGLIDPHIKLTRKNLKYVSMMVQAAGACIVSEEFRRPSIREIISVLTNEQPKLSFRKNYSFPTHGAVADCYPQLQQTDSEMRNHLALAMLGVPEFELDDPKLRL